MSLSLFAAVSQDGALIAASALGSVTLARLVNERSQFKCHYVVTASITTALLVLGRPPYAFIAGVFLLIQTLSMRSRLLYLSGTLLPATTWSLLASLFTSINTEAHRGVHPLQQLTGLLSHPGHVQRLIEHALSDKQGMEGLSFYKEFVGVLGWIDVVLPTWFYVMSGVALCSAMCIRLSEENATKTLVTRVISAYLILLSVGAVFLIEYLTWTPVDLPWIEGVQGRYFIPLALFVPLTLPKIASPLFGKVCALLRPCIMTYPFLSSVVAVVCVVRRYYL